MNSAEERVEKIIIEAYNNEGRTEISKEEYNALGGASPTLAKYGAFIHAREVFIYKLNELGHAFAREGCYSGIKERLKLEEERAAKAALLTEKQIKALKHNKILAITALIISAISLVVSLFHNQA